MTCLLLVASTFAALGQPEPLSVWLEDF